MIQSEAFGRTFWLDADDNFKSAPTLVNGGADYDARDYVSDWEDWDGVNVDLLLAIYRQLLTTKITACVTSCKFTKLNITSSNDLIQNLNFKENIKNLNKFVF